MIVSRRKYRLCKSWWDSGEPLGVFSINGGEVTASDGFALSLVAPNPLWVHLRRNSMPSPVSVSLSDAVEPSVADGVEETVFAVPLACVDDDRRMGTR
jgi:hypothetical protein